MKTRMSVATIIAIVLSMLIVVATPVEGDSNGQFVELYPIEYDYLSDTITIAGESNAEDVNFSLLDESGNAITMGGFIHVVDGKFSRVVSMGDIDKDGNYVISSGSYVVFAYTESTSNYDEVTFVIDRTVSNVKITPDQSNISMQVGEIRKISVKIEGCNPNNVQFAVKNGDIINCKFELISDGSITISALKEGKTSILLKYREYTTSIYVDVLPEKQPEEPTEVKEFTFSMKMGMDWDMADWGTSSFSETDLRDGIILKGTGTNAGEALENACNANGIPNEFISTHDGNNNDLRYWVVQIFGLRDVPLDEGDWKYWIQEHDGTYNQKSLGWYTDNSGTYSLTYGITSVDYGNEVQSIYIKTQPTKTEYEVGESFDPAGMVVMAKMSVGEDLQIHKYTVSPSKFSQPGDQKVTLTYRDKTATVNVKVTGDAIPVIPPITPDIPIEDEKTETHTEHDDKGNTTTTTTTTGKTQDGKDVEINEVVVSKTDGSSEGTKTQTVTGKDGSVSETVTITDKDKDGNVRKTVTGTTTDNKGNVTKTESESKLDKDGNGKTVSTTTVTGKDGSTMTKSSTSEKSKEGTETEETVIAQSKDGNVRTETTSKVGTDGKVEAETKTTVKADAGKEVGADTIEGALKQSDVTLANVSADKKDVKKVVELEVSNGTSAALSPEAVKKVSDYGAGLKVSGKEGSIDTDSDVLKNLAKDGKTVELSMEANNRDVLKDKQKDIVGDNHFVDLNALVGGENVHQLGGEAVITFGYQLKDGESSADLKVFYVDDEGNKTLVDATYADGHFTMTVDHFSVYMVENVSASESDDSGISPVLIAGILVVIIAAIVGVVLYTRKN